MIILERQSQVATLDLTAKCRVGGDGDVMELDSSQASRHPGFRKQETYRFRRKEMSTCKEARKIRRWAAVLIFLSVVLSACQSRQAPLSPAAASFKKEMREELAKLTPALTGTVSQGDVAAINAVLEKLSAEAIHAGRPWTFRIGILDRNGVGLAAFPLQNHPHKDFSSYDGFAKVFKDHQTVTERFYMQDGAQIYVIAAPLLRQDQVVGGLALVLSAADAQKKWGISEKEFMAIDFNS